MRLFFAGLCYGAFIMAATVSIATNEWRYGQVCLPLLFVGMTLIVFRRRTT